MNLRGHLTTGLVGVGGWVWITNQIGMVSGWAGAGAVCLIVGALAPDWDHGSSWITRRIPIVHLLYRFIGSNPLTWALAGRHLLERPQTKKEAVYKKPKNVDWLWKSVDNPLGRRILGHQRAKKAAWHWVKGRTRVKSLLGHRKAMHSGLGAMWATAGWWILCYQGFYLVATKWERFAYLNTERWEHAASLAAGFGIGYAIHLASDMVTIQGIPLWWPLSNKRAWLLPKTWRIRSEDS